MHEGKLVEYPIMPISPMELEMRHVTTVRVKGNLSLECTQTGPDISSAFQHLIEKVRFYLGEPFTSSFLRLLCNVILS